MKRYPEGPSNQRALGTFRPCRGVAWSNKETVHHVINSTIHGWVRRINGDRLEIFLKVEGVDSQPDRKIRASGPEAEMMELVVWFEEKTGLRVSSGVLPRRAPQPIPGQIELVTGELSSKDKVQANDG